MNQFSFRIKKKNEGVFKYLLHAKLNYMHYFQCKTAMDIILILNNILYSTLYRCKTL